MNEWMKFVIVSRRAAEVKTTTMLRSAGHGTGHGRMLGGALRCTVRRQRSLASLAVRRTIYS